MSKTDKKKLKLCNDDGLWSCYEERDCDPSCWEIEDECIDRDEMDRMMFGDDDL